MSVTEAIYSASRRHADLFKNSAALAVGTGSLAVLGFVFWLFAARLYPPSEIGAASGLISLMGVLSLIGEAGIGTLLIGELTRHPGRENGLVSAGMLTGLIFGLLGGWLGLAIIDLPGGLSIADGDRVLFFLGCGVTGLWSIVNESFIGRLQSHHRTVQQFVFSVAKLGFIVVVAGWMTGETAMLLSWLVGVVAALICGEVLLRCYGDTLLHRPDFRILNSLKRKALDHWLLDVGISAPGIIMPYLVAVFVSPTSNAAFTVLWMIVVIVSAVPGSLATTLFPTVNARPEEYDSKMKISFILSMLFATGCALIIFLYSQQILGLFSPDYARIGSNNLRFLGIGMIGSVVKFHACAAARLNDKMRSVSGWFAFAGIFELISVTTGCYYGKLEGLALGWSGAMLVEGGLMYWFLMRRWRPTQRQS